MITKRNEDSEELHELIFMDDVVPNMLQRLRAADIIRVAGLAIASLGQEYSRIGAVQSTIRRGTQLLGIVDTTNVTHDEAAPATNAVEETKQEAIGQHRYSVDVEMQSSSAWITNCTCSPNSHQLCRHAAALLYQWLAQPQSFTTAAPLPFRTSLSKHERDVPSHAETKIHLKPGRQMSGQVGRAVTVRGPTPAASLAEILAQIGLSELRSIAREHELATAGASKQQLMESITGILKRPEAVRKAAAALEKPQRQLLATMVLAGGAMTDEDLRGIYERFAFGQADKLQAILLSLQAKGLLFHTGLNSAPQQRIGLSSSVYDVGWSIPAEVQAALRVPVPITTFNIKGEDEASTPVVQEVKPYSLLSDLLLLARVLNGYRLEHEDERDERVSSQRATSSFSPAHLTNAFINDGTGGIVPPAALPSASLLETVQAAVVRSPLFLRYAVRLLRLADILHKDDTGTPNLRSLPNAARLLIGPTYADVARDLFELWLTQPSYEELYDLQEEGLRLRCRTTPLNHSILRPGELEAENCEARQWLVALIAQVQQDQWVSFPAFARFIYRLNPTFLQKRQRLFPSPHWWLEQEDGHPLQPKQMSDWMRAEGHYLARLIRGPLHWWGITDLALSQDGHLLGFRLTSMAGFLLNGLEWEDEQDDMAGFFAAAQNDMAAAQNDMLWSALDVSETGELLLSCSFDAWPLIALVEEFTEVAGVRNERLCYRLSPTFLAEALSRGQQPTLLLKILREMAAETPPNSPLKRLIDQLTNWTASYGRVRLYTGVALLEVADSMVLRELAATTSMEEQIVQSITPTMMILKRQGMAQMIEDLKRRGQTPLLHEEG